MAAATTTQTPSLRGLWLKIAPAEINTMAMRTCEKLTEGMGTQLGLTRDGWARLQCEWLRRSPAS
jgi:hypothetical protein